MNRKTTANMGFAIAGVPCFVETLVVNESVVLRMNGSANSPRHRKPPNRYALLKKRSYKYFKQMCKREIVKRLILLIAIVFPVLVYSQIDTGKYRLCFEMYWKCHTAIILDLNIDSTYIFRLEDDVSIEETSGRWIMNDSLVFLTPETIPDSIQTNIFETKLSKTAKDYWWKLSDKTPKNKSDNLIVINNYFNPAENKTIWIKQGDKWNQKMTDKHGCVFYNGEIADSIKFKVSNRNFEFATLKEEEPSLIRITIKEDYKDLVYRTLFFNYIRIENGTMFIDVAEEEKELKRLYFEKIKE